MKAENSAKLKFKVMFEKRPIWGLIVGLNVCVLLWLISVQEPVVFDVNTTALSSGSSSGSDSNSYITNSAHGQEAAAAPVAAALEQAHSQGSYGWGRDLLSNHLSAHSNEYDDVNLPASGSISTTLNLNNNSNNITKSTKSSKPATFSHDFDDLVKTTTKTNDLLLSNIEKLTSSPGTGVLNLKSQPTPSWSKLATAASALPGDDFNQLIDLKHFQFLLPQPVCGSHIEALILVHSAPKNQQKRQVIRDTWASVSDHAAESPLRVLFLLGAVNSTELQDDLQNENNIYGDIVQGSFVDDYRNMTYKHVTAFKWFLYNCAHAQILIKVDDDVYVNTPQLIKYLQDQQQSGSPDVLSNMIDDDNPTMAASIVAPLTTPNQTKHANTTTTTTSSTLANFFSIFNTFAQAPTPQPPSSAESTFNASQKLFHHPQNLLFCQKIIGSLVKRSYRSKWRVSFRDYSQRYYPPYCPGYAIIYSPDVIYRLYKAAQNSKYFWIDDVHITGVLAQQTNTTITTSSHYVLYSDECDQLLTGKTDLSETEFLFAWHSISAQKIKLLWYLQMMALQTADQLNYKKNTMKDVVRDRSHQRRDNQKRRTKTDAIYSSSSSHTHTSANGFR